MSVGGTEAVLRAVCGAVRDEGGDRVARVIAYGSRVTGTPRPNSDLDLMIVVFDEPTLELRTALRRAAGEAAPWPVNALVVSERRFEETKEIPGGMTYAPHTRGLELYRHPESPRGYTDLRPREEARRDLVRFWVRRGRVYLDVAREMAGWDEESRPGAASYARRAAEWALRGYFTAREIDTGKVHDFREMRPYVADRDPELAEELEAAAPLGRYPRWLDVTDRARRYVSEEEARDAIRRAARVTAVVEERVSGLLEGNS